MKTHHILAMLLGPLSIAFNPVVHAADASDASPFDLAPACMERTDSPSSNCVVKDEGTPRHTYAPPGQAGARPGTATNAGTTGTTSGSAAAPAGLRDGGRSRAATSSGK